MRPAGGGSRVCCVCFIRAREGNTLLSPPSTRQRKRANVRTEAPGKEHKHGIMEKCNVGPVRVFVYYYNMRWPTSEFPLVRGMERGRGWAFMHMRRWAS